MFICNSGLSQSYRELWNRDGTMDLSSIRQGAGPLFCPISQVMDEDGFPRKGFRRDAVATNTPGRRNMEFLCPEVVRCLSWIPTPKQVIKMTLIQESVFVTLCPTYLLIKWAWGLQTDEVLKQHLPFRTQKIFISQKR